MKNDDAKTEVKKSRMHSMALKGKGRERPKAPGTHLRKADGKVDSVKGSATLNPAPFTDIAAAAAESTETPAKK